MASLQAPSLINGADLYTSNATAPAAAYVGQKAYGSQGTTFRYVKVGGSNLVVGNMLQSPAIDTQFDDLAVNAALTASSTAFTISLTNGTTSIAANSLLGASATVSVTPGLGQTFTITGNTAATSGNSFTITVDRPVRTTLSTSSKVTIRPNPFNGVIQSPATTLTGTPVGACIFILATTEYGWIQSGGVGGALSDNTSIIAGSDVSVPSGTAGAVTLGVAGLPIVGKAMQAAATGKVIPVFLTLS